MTRIRTGKEGCCGFFFGSYSPGVLPQEITRLRERLGWSMSRLAREIGTKAELIVDWESGQRFPTKRHHDALRKVERTLLADKD